MSVIIDKFGRVLIPKAIRDEVGLEPGTELALEVCHGDDEVPSIRLRVVPESPQLVRESGRLVYTGAIDPKGQDIVAFIKAQRLERSGRTSGLDLIDPDDERDVDA